jgi:hypothetical protein
MKTKVQLNKRVRVWLEGERAEWMTLRTLRTAVLAGKADNWNVIETIETGQGLLICPYCATGVEHDEEHHIWSPPQPGPKHPFGTVH